MTIDAPDDTPAITLESVFSGCRNGLATATAAAKPTTTQPRAANCARHCVGVVDTMFDATAQQSGFAMAVTATKTCFPGLKPLYQKPCIRFTSRGADQYALGISARAAGPSCDAPAVYSVDTHPGKERLQKRNMAATATTIVTTHPTTQAAASPDSGVVPRAAPTTMRTLSNITPGMISASIAMRPLGNRARGMAKTMRCWGSARSPSGAAGLIGCSVPIVTWFIAVSAPDCEFGASSTRAIASSTAT